MTTTTHSQRRATFENSGTRPDEMHQTVETWIEELVEATGEARASERFQEWLDVQSRFHSYSYRNAVLIGHQNPAATHVAGYRAWREEFGRQVRTGERAIWIWAPIVAKRCPACENTRRYHDDIGCTYDGTPPENWSSGLVGFKPVPVFDVTQTEGSPLPQLDTATTGEAGELVPALLKGANDLDVDVRIVDESAWRHGKAMGVCMSPTDAHRPVVEVKARDNEADLSRTLIHEYAHTVLHVGRAGERAGGEVEAEAVAYLVGRHFGLDTSGSAFYLAAWEPEDRESIEDRLEVIRVAAETFIEAIGPDNHR